MNTMHKPLLLLSLATFLFVACDTQPANTYKPAPAIGNQGSAAGDAPVMMPEQATQAPQPAPASSSSTALNPEHGQPGHRCDIPVGSPLNSPASGPQEISTQLNTGQLPAATTTQPTTATEVPASKPAATSGKRLNPEHGQPGHDCAVAVGSPLP